jgi:hypothetical protein
MRVTLVTSWSFVPALFPLCSRYRESIGNTIFPSNDDGLRTSVPAFPMFYNIYQYHVHARARALRAFRGVYVAKNCGNAGTVRITLYEHS